MRIYKPKLIITLMAHVGVNSLTESRPDARLGYGRYPDVQFHSSVEFVYPLSISSSSPHAVSYAEIIPTLKAWRAKPRRVQPHLRAAETVFRNGRQNRHTCPRPPTPEKLIWGRKVYPLPFPVNHWFCEPTIPFRVCTLGVLTFWVREKICH